MLEAAAKSIPASQNATTITARPTSHGFVSQRLKLHRVHVASLTNARHWLRHDQIEAFLKEVQGFLHE